MCPLDVSEDSSKYVKNDTNHVKNDTKLVKCGDKTIGWSRPQTAAGDKVDIVDIVTQEECVTKRMTRSVRKLNCCQSNSFTCYQDRYSIEMTF